MKKQKYFRWRLKGLAKRLSRISKFARNNITIPCKLIMPYIVLYVSPK